MRLGILEFLLVLLGVVAVLFFIVVHARRSAERGPAAASDHPCPLCGGPQADGRRLLYGFPICATCHDRFSARRYIAFIVDAVLVFLVAPTAAALAFAASDAAQGSGYSLDRGWKGVEDVFGCFAIAFLLKDSLFGSSPGKFLTGIRVLRAGSAAPAGVWQSVKRTLPLLIPIVPLVAAAQLVAGPRIGDRWARTKVVWVKYADKLPFAVNREANQRTPPAGSARG